MGPSTDKICVYELVCDLVIMEVYGVEMVTHVQEHWCMFMQAKGMNYVRYVWDELDEGYDV